MDATSILSVPQVTPPLGDAASLERQAHSHDPRAIEQVAKGFEGLFASLLIKQMRQTLEPDSMFGDDKSDILGGLFDTVMGEHLGQTGALGIANMVRHQLTQPLRGRA